jgi:hypothetical protein
MLAEKGRDFSFRYFYGDDPGRDRLHDERRDAVASEIVAGALPAGLTLGHDSIGGIPLETGRFEFEVRAHANSAVAKRKYTIRVHGDNLAQTAMRIIHNESAPASAIELIRDGDRRSATFYNRTADGGRQSNFYGYVWQDPQTIATLVFNPGLPEEFGGWFTSLDVQYRDTQGTWRSVDGLTIDPAMNFDNSQWLKGAFIDHSLSFEPVGTTAIRIIGEPGGIPPDAHTGDALTFYSAISELAVYGD